MNSDQARKGAPGRVPADGLLVGARSGPTALRIALEKAASLVRSYEVQFVHGLMQTEDYARAVILIANAHASAEEIDRRVNVRMTRQQLLTQPDAPGLWAVLDEAALRRPLAGAKVMRAQLEHLL